MKRYFLCLLLAACCALPGMADVAHFKNGDRLTGEWVRVEGCKIVFKTETVGEAEIPTDHVESFESTLPPVLLCTPKDSTPDAPPHTTHSAAPFHSHTSPHRAHIHDDPHHHPRPAGPHHLPAPHPPAPPLRPRRPAGAWRAGAPVTAECGLTVPAPPSAARHFTSAAHDHVLFILKYGYQIREISSARACYGGS